MKYRKLPVVVDAIRWTGENEEEVWDFMGEAYSMTLPDDILQIYTLEGIMNASLGDYIIRGVQGEIYPCKPDIFKQTYERLD